MDTAIETLALDVQALNELIEHRFNSNLGVSGYIWEAHHAAQTELTRLRKERDALASTELKATWEPVLTNGL